MVTLTPASRVQRGRAACVVATYGINADLPSLSGSNDSESSAILPARILDRDTTA